MKIEDCEPGMRVECIKKKEYDNEKIEVGEILTIEGVFDIGNSFGNHVIFEEKEGGYHPSNFKLANKYEFKDKVIYKKLDEEVEIWGVEYNKIDNEFVYAIKTKEVEFGVVPESNLSRTKKKDELEVGDKFISYSTDNHMYKILSVEFDEHLDDKVYIVKTISEYHYGKIRIFNTSCIKEIIYD